MTTARQWLRHAKAALDAADVESARLDAELLLMHAWQVDRTQLITRNTDPLPDAVVDAAEQLLARRCRREPLAYLVGSREFWSRDFEVGPDVLIPRPETEHLIEAVLARFPDRQQPWRFADIGTGSGCLAVTLACEYPAARIAATDISAPALAVARRNAARHGVEARIAWHQGHLYDALPPDTMPFDAIVSNPPYVSRHEYQDLAPELRFEPAGALTDEADGLSLLSALLAGAPAHLAPAGYLMVETGPCGLPAPVPAMSLEQEIRDLAGLLRGGIYRHMP
jgi:release factor glutamine methyltransferase